MNNVWPSVFLALPAAMGLIVAGCNRAASRVHPDLPEPQAGAAAIKLHDANQDGVLAGTELDQIPGLKAALAQVDSNQDSSVTADEIDARIQSWANSRLGKMSLVCIVTRQGESVAGADVRLVPEKFLGGSLKTAAGTTNEQGIAMPSASAEADSPPGVSPGFYRVEITTAAGGVPLPARFNTATRLGIEVATDSPPLLNGDLQFEVGGTGN
jgi:hypothetical protein